MIDVSLPNGEQTLSVRRLTESDVEQLLAASTQPRVVSVRTGNTYGYAPASSRVRKRASGSARPAGIPLPIGVVPLEAPTSGGTPAPAEILLAPGGEGVPIDPDLGGATPSPTTDTATLTPAQQSALEAEDSPEEDPSPDSVALAAPAPGAPVEIDAVVPTDQERRSRAVRLRTPTVRRPVLGIVPRKPSFATLEIVVRGDNGDDEILLLDSASRTGRSGITSNFIVQSVTQGSEEAISLVRTLGNFHVSVNPDSEGPETVVVNGVLFDSENFPWAREWRVNYDRYLRAKQCLKYRARTYLAVNGKLYSGYILNTSMSTSVESSWTVVPFSFTMLLRDKYDLSDDQPRNERLLDGQNFDITVPDFVLDAQAGPTGFSADELDLRRRLEIIEQEGETVSEQILSSVSLSGDPPPDVIYREINLNSLLATVSVLNQAGWSIDPDVIRRAYILRRRAYMELMGIYDPTGPAQYGLPSEYQTNEEVRRRRVQREGRDWLLNDALPSVRGRIL